PYYLSIGMTYEQYWMEDPFLVVAYRKADKLRFERRNYEMWMQGLYTYEAICDVAPILQAFAKSGTRAIPYRDKPYATAKEDKTAVDENKKAEDERLLARISMFNMVRAGKQTFGEEGN
ncbi:MAG: hypothetical protein RR295_07765, partial [Oscillospiraceae bacterium]